MGVSDLVLLLPPESPLLLFRNPLDIIFSIGEIPVTIGRWLGVVAEDRAIGGDTRNGFINRTVSLCNINGNRHCLMFTISVLYKAPESIPHNAGVIV